jgi:hypothetical protein
MKSESLDDNDMAVAVVITWKGKDANALRDMST